MVTRRYVLSSVPWFLAEHIPAISNPPPPDEERKDPFLRSSDPVADLKPPPSPFVEELRETVEISLPIGFPEGAWVEGLGTKTRPVLVSHTSSPDNRERLFLILGGHVDDK